MDLKKEIFLITGAAGFVGASLTRRLVKMGVVVHALVSEKGNLWRLEDILSSIIVHRGDITDEVFVQGLIRQVTPSIIYHLATHGAYSSQNDTKRIIMTNVLGTSNLLEALARIPYKLFINTGSSSEYGFKQKPMQENDLPEPNSSYAVAKLAQTMLCQYTAKSQKKPIVTFRLFSVYGPYEDPSRLVPTVLRRCLQGEDLQMVSPSTARDFIYIEDVLDAYLNINALQNQGGEIINIGSGRQVILKDFIDTALGVTGALVAVHWNMMQERVWDSSCWVGDIDKAKQLLGWQAKTSLENGLRQTMDWFKRQ